MKPIVVCGRAERLPLPDGSVDAIVCDPPYGLTELPTRVVETALREWLNGRRDFVPDGRGFMSRDWDRFVPPPAAWDEAFRVLKPGGHLLAFAGARTVDLMGMSIRLAGFERRDSVTMLGWVQAQGFPKSLDVSKAIDKSRRRDYVLAAVDLGLTIPGNNLHDWTKAEHSPGDVWWERFKAALPLDDWQRIERAVIGQVTKARAVGSASALPTLGAETEYRTWDLTTPATEDAARWQGWHTALKPAAEPILLARKPLAGTVAANVLAYGTGAINVDGCRVEHASDADLATSQAKNPGRADAVTSAVYGADRPQQSGHDAGRWPTNLVLVHHPDCAEVGTASVRGDGHQDGLAERYAGDEVVPVMECVPGCPVAELDGQGGIRTSGANPTRRGTDKFRNTYGEFIGQREIEPARGQDSGLTSRFYPTFRFNPKADTWERPEVTLADGTVLRHPTVKPVDLMRWLVRLVCPPGGLVLDPFAGSGATLQAAQVEGFPSVGVELGAGHCALIRERLSWPVRVDEDDRVVRSRPHKDPDQWDLMSLDVEGVG